jgi:hypothetical protein
MEGVPVCVHPDKVGVPAARYKSDGISIAVELELPEDVSKLDDYLRKLLHSAAPGVLDLLIEKAMTEIPRSFPGVDITATLRRALN